MLTPAQRAAIAVFLMPFVMLILSILVLNPAKRFVQRNMKDGWLKRLLLKKTN